MDKEKFEKMFEMMKGCCTGEEGSANCCSMMKKMMQQGERKGNGEERKGYWRKRIRKFQREGRSF